MEVNKSDTNNSPGQADKANTADNGNSNGGKSYSGYAANVHKTMDAVIDIFLPRSNTAMLSYNGNESLPSENTSNTSINETQTEENRTESSNNTTQNELKISIDLNQTGNLIWIALLVLICLIPIYMLRRKK